MRGKKRAIEKEEVGEKNTSRVPEAPVSGTGRNRKKQGVESPVDKVQAK